MTARDPLDSPDAAGAADMFDEVAAGSVGSLTDEILMLDRPETEVAEPTVVTALHPPHRRIIFAAAAAVIIAGCASLTGSLSATGSKSPRPVPQAAPQAAAPNLPTPALAKPTEAGPAEIRPAPRHKPAPTRRPVQVATPVVLHAQPATARHTNSPLKPPRATAGAHPDRAQRTGALSKNAPPNLDAARARMRQVSAIISNVSREADAISRMIGLPRLPNGQ